jgi:hypothetical protein
MALILTETAASNIVDRLHKDDNLLDIAIDIESYLDDANLYVFKNWINGVLVQGPSMRKYWVDVTFKYDVDEMPDPDGALRLLPHGTQVRYSRAHELVPQPIRSPDDYEPGTKKPRMKKTPVWLVHMSIPRRFIEAVNQDLIDQYDLEADDAENAEEQMAQTGGTQQ